MIEYGMANSLGMRVMCRHPDGQTGQVRIGAKGRPPPDESSTARESPGAVWGIRSAGDGRTLSIWSLRGTRLARSAPRSRKTHMDLRPDYRATRWTSLYRLSQATSPLVRLRALPKELHDRSARRVQRRLPRTAQHPVQFRQVHIDAAPGGLHSTHPSNSRKRFVNGNARTSLIDRFGT